MIQSDDSIMREALAQAREAYDQGEIPIGCVLVQDGEVIARAHNLRESLSDPTAHAEMLVLREASQKLGRWRLTGATLYVTMEPCSMCAGALVLARISRLVYGCADPKAGACGSVMDIVREPRLNHRIEVISGVLEQDCRDIIRSFFETQRESVISKKN